MLWLVFCCYCCCDCFSAISFASGLGVISVAGHAAVVIISVFIVIYNEKVIGFVVIVRHGVIILMHYIVIMCSVGSVVVSDL